MYYFLAHQLLGQQINDNRKMVRAQNTFLLALDGDVDFQPQALLLLIDRLKLNPQVGAACGRIHPIGSGREKIHPIDSGRGESPLHWREGGGENPLYLVR